ncbi:MAG: CoA ester lyase [Betaproteobacteria bacterium]|nr:CoA ester lyase [Betaproteobacteria bacterium]NDH30246.1 CoA ester lyase [Betaproteobacteria bacterium]
MAAKLMDDARLCRMREDTPMRTNDADLPIWRSILFVPATSARFIESAVRQAADALQIDLEDSVSPQEKDVARAAVAPIARSFVQAGKAVIVRVNRPWRLLVRDLEASVCEAVSAISLPKVPDAGFIKSVAEVLSELEFERGLVQGHTRLIAMIEDPEGVHHVDAIAQAHARMLGLIVGAEDLAVSMHMAVNEDTLYTPNIMALIAARRAGLMPLGFIGSVADYKDQEAFRKRIERARSLGFEGAFCVHPSQVPIMNEGFAPQASEVEHARGLMLAFEQAQVEGKAAFAYKGRMVDLPVIEQARRLLAKVERLKRFEKSRDVQL